MSADGLSGHWDREECWQTLLHRLPTRSGDIRLDLNLEYRTKMFWKFELAAYVDAGNVWMMKPDKDHKDGNFDFSRFYKEIAVSYGLGIASGFRFLPDPF